MFSSSSFDIKTEHIYLISYSLVKMRPQYVAAMAHQDVFQQQINNIDKFLSIPTSFFDR